ncbi:hypothetical protein C8Q76DRAFT_804541 [Earliella scabrosa]|nr:hypothetical protein C8Q76DRAFT_804541 [Earliella scabrosa]
MEKRAHASPVPIPLVVLGVKPDTDTITSALSVDDALRIAMRKFDADWTRSGNRKNVSKNSCCPIFGVTIVGSYLHVYGSIYTERWISHHLMDPCDIRPSSVVDVLAGIFNALHLGLIHLRDWHHRDPYTRALEPRGILIPSPSAFLDSSGKRIRFKCSSSILQNLYVWHSDPSPLDWHNRTDRFVTKFARTYGEDAHHLLAEADYAPTLVYCGPPYAAYPDLDVYQPITMVIMKWCGNRTLAWGSGEPATTERVRAAVKLLHDHGMVHGDLRGQNVLIQPRKGGAVRIIDFDWAGKEGEARYPNDLSPAVRWPPGAKAGGLITKAHDWHFVDRYFTPGQGRVWPYN